MNLFLSYYFNIYQEFSKWVSKKSSLLDLAEQKGNYIESGSFQVSSDPELGIWWCFVNKKGKNQ